MTQRDPGEASLDATLVAYLDGELEPNVHEQIERLLESDAIVRERLALLSRTARPFRASFQALLRAAPNESLQTMLAASVTNSNRSWLTHSRKWASPLAALLLSVIAAGIAGYFIGQTSDTGEAWLDAVAAQVSLYSEESVSSIPVDKTAQQAELSRLGKIFAFDFAQGRVELPGLALKRVELLRFHGRPLGQLLYEGHQGPVALCVMIEPNGESSREAEQRAGLNTLYWSAGERRFLLVSRAPLAAMEEIADVIVSRFPSSSAD